MSDYRAAPRRTNDSPLARLRMERGMTQGQLAEMIGCRQDMPRLSASETWRGRD